MNWTNFVAIADSVMQSQKTVTATKYCKSRNVVRNCSGESKSSLAIYFDTLSTLSSRNNFWYCTAYLSDTLFCFCAFLQSSHLRKVLLAFAPSLRPSQTFCVWLIDSSYYSIAVLLVRYHCSFTTSMCSVIRKLVWASALWFSTFFVATVNTSRACTLSGSWTLQLFLTNSLSCGTHGDICPYFCAQ